MNSIPVALTDYVGNILETPTYYIFPVYKLLKGMGQKVPLGAFFDKQDWKTKETCAGS